MEPCFTFGTLNPPQWSLEDVDVDEDEDEEQDDDEDEEEEAELSQPELSRAEPS